jgi:hypothetical protein
VPAVRSLLWTSALSALCAACGDAAPPPAASAAEPAPPVFEETARAAGIAFRMAFIPTEQGEQFKINMYDHGSGLAVGDYDGDGRDDVYFCNQCGGNALYHNDGGGKFTDVTASAGADIALADRIKVAATFADYDNDGRQDLFVTSTRGGNALFRNEGGGRFADVTEKAGVAKVAHSQSAAFFDADADGDLDLLVACTAKWTEDTFDPRYRYYVGPKSLLDNLGAPTEPNLFYVNRGDGTFADATAESGLAGRGWNCDVVVLDYDGDGAQDVFVTSMFGSTSLFHGDGRGRFTDVTRASLGVVSYGALGASALDYDGDGRLDLLVADMHSDMWVPADFDTKLVEESVRYPMPYGPLFALHQISGRQADDMAKALRKDANPPVFGNTLYRNKGGGAFEEVSGPAGAETFQPWGAVAADYRNAGALDVFVPSGMGYPFFVWGNRYLLNLGGGKFAERAQAAGLDPPPGGPWLEEQVGGKPAARSSRAAATSDFDGDGRLDLVVNNFNDRAWLLMNRTPARHWVELRLRGTRSNRDAIGAFVTLRAGGRTQVRQVTTNGGYLSQSSKTLHFGLGDAASIDSCEIRWPGGAVQKLEGVAPGRLHDVEEPAK